MTSVEEGAEFPRPLHNPRHAFASAENANVLPAQRKFAICKPLGLSSIRNDTSSALGLHPACPIPSLNAPVSSASYESTPSNSGRDLLREISPATTRCGNVREIRATSAALSETRDALRPRIKIFRAEGYGIFELSAVSYSRCDLCNIVNDCSIIWNFILLTYCLLVAVARNSRNCKLFSLVTLVGSLVVYTLLS